MIDMEKYYGHREEAAREGGNDVLSYTYLRLGLIERLSRSGQLSEDMSRMLRLNAAAIHLHAGGLVADCGNCGCLVDEKWDFCPRCGVHFIDLRYIDDCLVSDPE